MSISVGGSTASASPYLLNTLEATGLSAAKAKTAGNDLVDAAVTALDSDSDVSDADFRKALDSRIDADVANGTLSKDDAAKVKKALDQIEGDVGDDADGSTDDVDDGSDAAPVGGGGGAGGGGGGGASTEKTEVSRTVTVTGSIKTTVITYSDGTSATETGTATDADRQKHGKAASPDDRDVARNYLAQTPPGSLIDASA